MTRKQYKEDSKKEFENLVKFFEFLGAKENAKGFARDFIASRRKKRAEFKPTPRQMRIFELSLDNALKGIGIISPKTFRLHEVFEFSPN
jgi:hypothetical protein